MLINNMNGESLEWSVMSARYSSENIFSIVFGFLLSVLGIWGVYLSINEFIIEQQSLEWPSVTGQIIESKVSSTYPGVDSVPYYFPEVKYLYIVNNMAYTGNKLCGDPFPTFRSAKDTVVRLSIGKEVRVFYNPVTPQIACVEVEHGSTSGSTVGALLLSLYLLVLGGFLILSPDRLFKLI